MEINKIPPRSGVAFKLLKGHYLKVICPEGEQVSDMVAFNANDLSEKISNGKTMDYEETLRLTTGNFLYSNKSNKMLEIVEDSCGVHDFLLAPCCSETLRIFYDIKTKEPTCHGNLYESLSEYGVDRWEIPTAFNIFMNVEVNEKLKLKVSPPKAELNDYVIFKANMDLIIGLTACSAGASNNYSFKPIDYIILTELS